MLSIHDRKEPKMRGDLEGNKTPKVVELQHKNGEVRRWDKVVIRFCGSRCSVPIIGCEVADVKGNIRNKSS